MVGLEHIWNINEKRLSGPERLLLSIVKRFVITWECITKNHIMSYASALTYSSMLATVPVLAIVFAIARGFGFDTIIETRLRSSFESNPDIADTILFFVDSYLQHTKGGVFIGIGIIFLLHIVILVYEFLIAGGLSRKSPLRLLVNMLPAYFTALGTSSSAATIPVTLQQTKKNGVSDEIASFCVPLCATIHIAGSMMKITCCALTVCLISGLPHDLPLFLHFILLLGVCMVAAPGVPGGAAMAALGPLAGVLGFTPEAQALIIALYIAMDSFGTACNVTGDGALAVIIDKLHKS